ncbi:DUF2007 domain-containing protein [Guyparkeria hydrothermalis]|uniref:putative signal transducing protein n=1 Tax=Guyparkeria hydrothermalis TaxID=923 RepID=UPI0020208264|nr:DUF2007 domain-containing protein [Guyparkeria hydrothermalis]MCL7744302.1 DUF2007 domain-containing protein [Guyparkeria hydrothermalis]
MKTIYRATDILEAHIVAGMLNAEGIEAEVAGFYQQGAVGELAPQDFARVMLVDERDTARAEQVIASYEAREPEPAHDEPDVEGDGGAAGRLAGWLLVVALLLFLLSWGVL